MEISRLSDLRPRFTWDIIDDAFDLYRERFTLMLGVNAFVFLPTILIFDLACHIWAKPIVDSSERSYAYFLLFAFLGIPLELLGATLRWGAVATVVDAQFHGRPPGTIARAYRETMHHGASLLGVGLLAAILATLAACVSFGIGAVWFLIAAAFIAPAVVLEGRRPLGALRRSFALAGSDQGRVFGIMVLLSGLTACLAGGLGLLAGGLVQLIPLGDASAATHENFSALTSEAIIGLLRMVLEPLLAIAMTLLYFDLRVRRQGIDLAAQAEEHGIALAPDPFGDTNSDRVIREQQRRQRKLDKLNGRRAGRKGVPIG